VIIFVFDRLVIILEKNYISAITYFSLVPQRLEVKENL
jgi:hypothetical protein